MAASLRARHAFEGPGRRSFTHLKHVRMGAPCRHIHTHTTSTDARVYMRTSLSACQGLVCSGARDYHACMHTTYDTSSCACT